VAGRQRRGAAYGHGKCKACWRARSRMPVVLKPQGSSVQLPSYNLAKTMLAKQGWADNSFMTYLVASMVSGVSVCAAMQPADTVLTRMYNRESATCPEHRSRGRWTPLAALRSEDAPG